MQPRLVGPFVRLWAVFYGPAASKAVFSALATGASYVIIPPFLMTQLGYQPQGAGRYLPMTTASETVRAPLITLDAISLVGYRIPGVEALCYQLPRRLGVECLIGLSALRHFDIDLHFRSGKFELRVP